MKQDNSLDIVLAARMDDVREARRYRPAVTSIQTGVMVEQDGQHYLSFCSNDYLGLAREVTSYQVDMAGARASRLVTGNHPAYQALEVCLADMKGAESALVYGSGYLANIGVISALMGRGDLMLMDKYAHACMLDGAQLSGAKLMRFRHNDMMHLEQLLVRHRHAYRHCMIATETVFSMDGDIGDVATCHDLAQHYDAWCYSDDAHGFGLRHLPENHAEIQVGTLSKAAGAYGGYVVGSHLLIDYVRHHARSIMFSTALPEALVRYANNNIVRMHDEPARAERVMMLATRVTDALEMPSPASPIIPIIIGDNAKVMQMQDALKQDGILVSAIRPPTVPEGTARLRISMSAAHDDAHVAQLIMAFKKVLD